MTTSKINPNATSISKLEEVSITTTNHNPYHHDTQQRIFPSKRTTTKMINNLDQSVDHHTTTVHQSRIHHSTRSVKTKDNKISNVSKLESESEEVYTAPSNLSPSICQKQQLRQGVGDYGRKDNIDDADEESTTVMSKNKIPIEHVHRLSAPSNNSASRLQQQGMGDHYHISSKQHKSRSKTTTALNRKYHRLIEQQDLDMTLDERNAYRWRLTMYIIIILVLSFVIYRFILTVWPKPKKTFIEQLIDNLSTFFTP
jgi:hypothetical protein